MKCLKEELQDFMGPGDLEMEGFRSHGASPSYLVLGEIFHSHHGNPQMDPVDDIGLGALRMWTETPFPALILKNIMLGKWCTPAQRPSVE